MNITEVRVKRLERRSDRLRAFCSITIDDEFVVHDLRVIEGRKGLFVAMPSRKLTDKCPSCSGKNHLRAGFCNQCGSELDKDRERKRDKYHVDVAHPIVTACRDKVKEAVLEAFHEECGEAKEDADGPPEGEAAKNGIEEEEEDWSESEMDFDYYEEDNDDADGVGPDEPSGKRSGGSGQPADRADGSQDGEEGEEEMGADEEDQDGEGGFGDGIF